MIYRGDEEEEKDKSCKPTTVLHTHRRAVCIMTFSLVLISVHRLTNYTNMSKLRLTVAPGDTCSLKLQHKALLCCNGDICTIWATVLGPLMQCHVGISLDLHILSAHISYCTYRESVLDCYCVFKYSHAQDSQCFCRLRCQTFIIFHSLSAMILSVFFHCECTHLYLDAKSLGFISTSSKQHAVNTQYVKTIVCMILHLCRFFAEAMIGNQ